MQRSVVADSKDVEIETTESDNFPSELCCSILFTPLEDPVIGDDGHFYERSAIMRRLKDNARSPFTGKNLLFFDSPFLAQQIKDLVKEWKENNIRWKNKVEEQKKENELLKNKLAEVQHFTREDKVTSTVEERKIDGFFIHAGKFNKSRSNYMLLKSITEICSIRSVKRYISEGADINCFNNDTGDTALMTAIKMQSTHPDTYQSMIKFLCEILKVDIHKKNFKGQTAIDIAAEKHDAWAIEFLLAKGAKIERRAHFVF